MRIILFTRRHWPSVGGVEKYIQRLAQALAGLGHDPMIITGAHRDGLPPRELVDGIPVHRYPAHRSPARAWYHLMRMSPLFAQADLVHVSDTAVLEYYYRMLAWRFPDKPLFLTRHGMSYICPVPQREIARAKRTLNWVDGIVHDGVFIEKWLKVEPDCVPNQGLWPEADDIRPAPDPPPDSAVFVGRLENDSGIWIYLNALKLLQHQHNTVIKLDVYGDGTQTEKLKQFTHQHQLPVAFHGWREDAQKRIVDGAFAFVAGRMAMQEAMARRRLVVAAYVDPLKRDYVCGEPFSPFLVSGGDAESIANHLLQYLSDQNARSQLVSRAFEYARQLSWRKTALAYCDLWRRAPRRKARTRSTISRVRLASSLWRERRQPQLAAAGMNQV